MTVSTYKLIDEFSPEALKVHAHQLFQVCQPHPREKKRKWNYYLLEQCTVDALTQLCFVQSSFFQHC